MKTDFHKLVYQKIVAMLVNKIVCLRICNYKNTAKKMKIQLLATAIRRTSLLGIIKNYPNEQILDLKYSSTRVSHDFDPSI